MESSLKSPLKSPIKSPVKSLFTSIPSYLHSLSSSRNISSNSLFLPSLFYLFSYTPLTISPLLCLNKWNREIQSISLSLPNSLSPLFSTFISPLLSQRKHFVKLLSVLQKMKQNRDANLSPYLSPHLYPVLSHQPTYYSLPYLSLLPLSPIPSSPSANIQ